MIVALELPLKLVTIILGCILTMLLNDFNALGPISMPSPPTVALIEFFYADIVASIHPLPVSWYLISSLSLYLCSCMNIFFILCSTADAVSSGSWPILFKVLTCQVNLASLTCDMDRWPCSKALASPFCGCWFDLQWWRPRYALLMRPNKVETVVQCYVCHM